MRKGIRSYKDKASFVQSLTEKFPYVVDLPNPTSQFEDANWVVARDEKKAQRYVWLSQNVGKYDSNLWDWSEIKCLMPDGRHGISYFFLHQHHALLFKLTWGGN